MNNWIKRGRVRFICAVVLAVTLVLLAVSFGTGKGGITVFGTELGADYAAFYVAGKILNEYPATQLYDLDLQHRVSQQVLPGRPAERWLPFRGYPPLVAVFFRPLARLPYAWSYFAWLVISAALYVAGFVFIWKTLRALPAETRSTALLLALSFEPFLMEAWVGGQLSAVGFFWIALALFCEDRQRPILAGAALAVCLYKPTLLLLIVPLLLMGRRFKTLASFCLSGILLAGGGVLWAGQQPWREYVKMLIVHLQDATQSAAVFRDWKFVDVVSFVRLLTGGGSALGQIAILIVCLAAFLWLAVAWWKSKSAEAGTQRLLWATTLTGTLVVNVYVGIYDVVLVVISALLTANALYRRAGNDATPFPPVFKVWLALLYVVPWFSQELARVTHFQLYTVVLAGFAAYQFGLAGVSRFRLESRA